MNARVKVSMLEDAQKLAAMGLRVFQLTPGAKAPPLEKGWQDRATTDKNVIEMLWGGGVESIPGANIGILALNLLIIDVDVAKGGNESLQLLELQSGLPATLTTRTPTGGRHLFYRLPKDHPGVGNTVGALGAGLDIRSTGTAGRAGYVVGPGSIVSAGEYKFEDATVPIAEAPEWLVQKLGTAREKQNDGQPVPDAPGDVVKRARTWLEAQPGAIEGRGGDAWTYKVACGLRDMGASAAQAFELMSGEWNARCAPSWTPEELDAKVRNAFAYGQNPPASRAALPSDFPAVEKTAGAAPSAPARRCKFLTVAELTSPQRARRGYLVKGILGRGSYAELFGAPGAGKSFVALNISYSIAQGWAWMGYKVRGGPVLYLPYEGGGGMGDRAKALREQYGDTGRLHVAENPNYNLRELQDRHALGDDIAGTFGEQKPALIVIDTFARALMGGDENSAQDVGAFNSAVAALTESTGATVMIIHHSGKDKSKGARGSSALLGAIDTEIEVDDKTIFSRKQRDWTEAPPIGFRLTPVLVGVDEDGDDVFSCIVEPAAGAKARKLSPLPQKGMKALEAVSPNNAPIDEETWKVEFVETAWRSNDKPAPKEQTRAFRKVVTALADARLIEKHGKLWARAMTGPE